MNFKEAIQKALDGEIIQRELAGNSQYLKKIKFENNRFLISGEKEWCQCHIGDPCDVEGNWSIYSPFIDFQEAMKALFAGKKIKYAENSWHYIMVDNVIMMVYPDGKSVTATNFVVDCKFIIEE